MDERKLYTLAVLVDNAAGVLSQVSRLFSRKGYNIESLAVGVTENPEISRITIEVIANEDQIILLSNQLGKLLPVHSVKILSPDNSVRLELVMVKFRTPDSATRNDLLAIADTYKIAPKDLSVGSLTLAMVANDSKMDGLSKFFDEYEVMELVRTGYVAMERDMQTIYEDTKEKGEFNYGKNVL